MPPPLGYPLSIPPQVRAKDVQRGQVRRGRPRLAPAPAAPRHAKSGPRLRRRRAQEGRQGHGRSNSCAHPTHPTPLPRRGPAGDGGRWREMAPRIARSSLAPSPAILRDIGASPAISRIARNLLAAAPTYRQSWLRRAPAATPRPSVITVDGGAARWISPMPGGYPTVPSGYPSVPGGYPPVAGGYPPCPVDIPHTRWISPRARWISPRARWISPRDRTAGSPGPPCLWPRSSCAAPDGRFPNLAGRARCSAP